MNILTILFIAVVTSIMTVGVAIAVIVYLVRIAEKGNVPTMQNPPPPPRKTFQQRLDEKMAKRNVPQRTTTDKTTSEPRGTSSF